MAFTYSSPSYVGEVAADLIADLLLDGETISAGLISVHENVKKAEKIQSIVTDAQFAALSDDFTASGTTTVSEKELAPTGIQTQDEIGLKVLESSWQARQQAPGKSNVDLPSDMGQWIIMRKAEIITAHIDTLLWQGDTTLSSDGVRKWHDGLIKLMKADSDVSKYAASVNEVIPTGVTVGSTTVITVASTSNINEGDIVTCLGFTGADAATLNGLDFVVLSKTATTFEIDVDSTGDTITVSGSPLVQFINKSNVIATLEIAFRRLPKPLRQMVKNGQTADLVVYVPYHVGDAFQDAILALGNGNGFAIQNEQGYQYKGLKIAPLGAIPDNHIVITRTSNIWFGTDLVSDQNQVDALYMYPLSLETKYRYSAKFSSSVNFGFGTQILMVYPQ